MFDTLGNRLDDIFRKLRSRGRLTEKEIDEALRESRVALLMLDTVDFPIEGPGTFKLKLVRQGATITVSAARKGWPLRSRGAMISNTLAGP